MSGEYKCPVEGCSRDFNSELLLNAHIAAFHPKWKKEQIIDESEEMVEEERLENKESKDEVVSIDELSNISPPEDLITETEIIEFFETPDTVEAEQEKTNAPVSKEKEKSQIEGDLFKMQVHGNEFKCPIKGCNRTFAFEEHLESHMEFEHNIKKADEEDIGDKLFKLLSHITNKLPKMVKKVNKVIPKPEKENIFLHIRITKGTGIKGRIMEQMDLDPDVEVVSSSSGEMKKITPEYVMENVASSIDFTPSRYNENRKYY